MARKYTGTSDAPAKGNLPGMMELMRLINKRWGFTFHGGYNNRPILSGTSKGKLSVHATGRAIDVKYPDTKYGRDQAVQVWVWLLENTERLQIEAIHDYAHGDFGQGYKCTRGEGCAGVVEFTAARNAGSIGGKWLHIEIAPSLAHSRVRMRTAWLRCKKPVIVLGPRK